MVQAYTGSGKTGAYLIPVIQIISTLKIKKKLSTLSNKDSPFAIIITPTRGLSEQIYEDCKRLVNGEKF